MKNDKYLDKIKNAHADYYRDIKGPIGGNERFRWVRDEFFNAWNGLKILEIGCGEASLLEMLMPHNQVFGIEISKSAVDIAHEKGITCHHLDASNERIPYNDSYFDAVVTLETIEHVENPHRMIWEIKRVLKDKGMLLISVPGERVFHPFIYPGLFTRTNFNKFLLINDFDILNIKGWGQAPLMDHWVRKVRAGNNSFLKKVADILFYIGRKRNLLLRKRLKTPLAVAYTVNFLCSNKKSSVSAIEKLGKITTPH
jgi:SAM-dependent methyltransferase